MARSDVITTAKRIRRQLGSGYRNEQGVLQVGLDASAVDVVFNTNSMLKSVQPGVTLAIGTELMRVTSVDATAFTARVTRGYLDSVAATHAIGDEIDISPRFSLLDIVDAMISEIDSWGIELYRIESQTIAVATEAQTLDLPVEWTEIFGVVSIHQAAQLTTASQAWPTLPAKVIRGANFTGAPTSGILLRFLEGIRHGSLFITVALPFDTDTFDDDTDLLIDLHLTKSMLDVLELGVRSRVIMANDDTRTARSAQDEARRGEETAQLGSYVSLSQLRLGKYMRRKNDEMSRLRRQYPIRML